MTVTFEASDRLRSGAEQWEESRSMGENDALETKVEQALLEIEHLVSGGTSVEFTVEGRTITFDPSAELEAFLAEQAQAVGLEPDAVLALHVDLFAQVFLETDSRTPDEI